MRGEGSQKLANGEEAKLNFYNWDTYIGETTLADFKGASGIDVKMDLFATNDELFAKFRAGNPGYDVIVPSNDFVERMVAGRYAEALDHSLIPNIKNVEPNFIDVAYDKGRKYSMPYTWLTLGIGYRKTKVKARARQLESAVRQREYTGRIALLTEAGDLFRLYAQISRQVGQRLTPTTSRRSRRC